MTQLLEIYKFHSADKDKKKAISQCSRHTHKTRKPLSPQLETHEKKTFFDQRRI